MELWSYAEIGSKVNPSQLCVSMLVTALTLLTGFLLNLLKSKFFSLVCELVKKIFDIFLTSQKAKLIYSFDCIRLCCEHWHEGFGAQR